ncbi:MAG TPA: Ig-like domain-containing protein [Gemmatimonadales bacterium]|jgi:plastocyanin|nr:Ig-like domain-containing protein [Gemmatimonadales bacterium]
MAGIDRAYLRPLVVGLGIGLAACGGSGGNTTPSTTAIAKASAGSGDAQTGVVGQALALPLKVVVTDAGAASAGATVTWSTTAAGASVNPASAVTDANGIASSAWTLGDVAGSQSASATLSGATGSPVIFSATATPDGALSMAKAGGDNQTAEVGAQLAAALQAKVADQFGNGVPGVNVSWATTGATVSAPAVPTDASGVSAVNVTLGNTVGPITITATAAGLTGSPLTFNATAAAAVPVPTTAAVSVGDIFFASAHNGSSNPAVDTVAINGTVTWTWAPTEAFPHSVESTGSPNFTSSAVQTGPGKTYQFTFTAPGTYQYDCAIHGPQMTGRIVVR